MPVMRECRYVDSLWEIKTGLPQSKTDDSRPIIIAGTTFVVGMLFVRETKDVDIYAND